MNTSWVLKEHPVYPMYSFRKHAHAIYRFFLEAKDEKFIGKILIFFSIFSLKTYIVSTASEAVLTSTHNVCFESKIRKLGLLPNPQFFYIKVGFKGVFISRTWFPDVVLVLFFFV